MALSSERVMSPEAMKAAELASEESKQQESHGRTDAKRRRSEGGVLLTKCRNSSVACCKLGITVVLDKAL